MPVPMRIMAAIIALGLTGCWDADESRAGATAAATTAETIETMDRAATDCALSIRFGSYAMGIDRSTATRIEALVSADGGVTGATRHPWGREGEYTLCVQTRSAEEAEALFERIKPLLPAEPHGPIQVALRDGRRYSAPER